MSRVSTYINTQGRTEEAFNRYAAVFGTEFVGPVVRMADMAGPDAPLTDDEKKLVGHVELPILAGHVLMGTDMVESMGQVARIGNNVTMVLDVDTKAEADRLYNALSAGGSDMSGMSDMPWAYWGTCLDEFGVRWMFNSYEGRDPNPAAG